MQHSSLTCRYDHGLLPSTEHPYQSSQRHGNPVHGAAARQHPCDRPECLGELCRVWRGTPVFRGTIRRRGIASHTLPSPLLSTADYTITGKRGARVPSLPDVWCRTSLIILPPNQVDRDPAPPAIIPPRLALPGTTRNTRQHCPSVQPPAFDASTISEISLPSSSNWR